MADDRTTTLAVLLDDLDRDQEPARRRHPGRNVLVGMALCLAVLVAIPLVALTYVDHRIESHIHRIPGAFAGLTDRPARATGAAAQAMNVLVLGTDRRSDVPTTGTDAGAPAWVPGAQRSDTLMLLHIDADRRGASLVSVPRDSWVPIPGHGLGKVNWAYSFGGPALAVATFERLTSIRVDHLVVVDWDGFMALTDAVGGVDVDVPQTVHDSARNITWTAGPHHLNGQQALDYVGERYGLPGGDLDRVRRQQAFLRALMQDALQQEMRKEPALLYRFLDQVTQHVSVDDRWGLAGMAELAFSLRNMRSANIRYLTAPVAGLGHVGDQSVVRLAPGADRDLWQAIREDRMDQWSAVNWRLLTPNVVN